MRAALSHRLLRSLGAEPAVVDGLDRGATHEAVARDRPDVIIHQMTGLTGAGDMRHFDRTFAVTNALRTIGTDYLLEAARATGTGRFISFDRDGKLFGVLAFVLDGRCTRSGRSSTRTSSGTSVRPRGRL
jgi:hypothetical protein